jgi:hypothetical protein
MTDSVCVCCGTYRATERHHVGGQKHSDVITSVCAPCHRTLTAWDRERAWPIGSRALDRIFVGTLDILCMVIQRADCGDLAIDVAGDLDTLVRRSGVFAVRPASYDIDVPDVIPDRTYDYTWFDTVATLLRDVARIVLTSIETSEGTPHEGLDGLRINVLNAIADLDSMRAFTRAYDGNLGRVLRYLLAELETVIGQAMLDLSRDQITPMLDLNRDDRMPTHVRAEIVAHMMRSLHDVLESMTTVKPFPMDG